MFFAATPSGQESCHHKEVSSHPTCAMDKGRTDDRSRSVAIRSDNFSISNPDHSIGSKKAGLILLAIFLTSLIALIIIYRNFPNLDPSERDKIRVPKNLNDAKELASVLSRYREKYYGSVFCGVLLAYVL